MLEPQHTLRGAVSPALRLHSDQKELEVSLESCQAEETVTTPTEVAL